MFGRTIEVLGSVIVTLRLHDIVKYGNFKINVRAYVVEDLAVPTYVCHGDWLLDQDWKRTDTIFCDSKNGNCVIVRMTMNRMIGTGVLWIPWSLVESAHSAQQSLYSAVHNH